MRERVRALVYAMAVSLVVSLIVWLLTGREILAVFLPVAAVSVMWMVYWGRHLGEVER